MASHPMLRVRPAGSFIQGSLPTGCALCEAGTKLVLFLTGVCHYKCFYCPISTEKRMSPLAYANERKLDFGDEASALAGLAEEVRNLGAKGTGITGGDPLYDAERTVKLIRFLKQEFGQKHHIHLYTQIPFDVKWLKAMQEAGLDELRFHPPDETWPDPDAFPQYTKLWLAAKRMEDDGLWDVGFEIPCIPGSHEQMSALVGWLDRHRFKFINVNEMEFSETNYEALLARGYRIKDNETSRAMDSEEVAREVMRRHQAAKIAIHFCSSPFKDRVQLRQRLARQAARVAKPYEVATEDGTLVRGVIACDDPQALAEEIVAAFEIEATLYEVKKDHLLVAPWLLEQFADEVPYPAYFSEIYPTATALEVERVPLNEAASSGKGPRGGTPSGRAPEDKTRSNASSEQAPPPRKAAVIERELADLHRYGRPGQ